MSREDPGITTELSVARTQGLKRRYGKCSWVWRLGCARKGICHVKRLYSLSSKQWGEENSHFSLKKSNIVSYIVWKDNW